MQCLRYLGKTDSVFKLILGQNDSCPYFRKLEKTQGFICLVKDQQ